MNRRVGVLAFLGGLALVVSLGFLGLLIAFTCSPEFDSARYGALGIVETFAMLAATAALGFLFLVWAKRLEKAEERAKELAFLDTIFAIEATRRPHREAEQKTSRLGTSSSR